MPIHTSLPKIEGFQPIPNAVMIPFMEAQSAALAYGFGLNYEYGKRTIRSKSNDEFNSLTSEDIARMSAAHTTIILKEFIQAVPKVMPAQTEIFKQYVTIEKAKVIQNVELAKWIIANGLDILLTGKTGTDIKDPSIGGGTPSKGTTITQDKYGNVITTEAPVSHEVALTESLSISDTTKKISSSVQAKLIHNYNVIIIQLSHKIEEEIGKVNWKEKSRNVMSFRQGNKPYAGSERLAILYKELDQQRRFLSRVKRGLEPY